MRPVRPAEEIELIKEKILDTALHLIHESGFSALTMRKLGQSLGMTAANLYNYYRSKDEIYITLMIRGFQRLRDEMRKAATTESEPLAKGKAIMMSYVEFGLHYPEHYELMFSIRAPKAREYEGTEVESLSQQELKLSMELAGFAEACVGMMAEAVGLDTSERQRRNMLIELWSMLHGMVSLHLTGNADYVTDQPLETYRHVISMTLERFFRIHGN